MMILILIFFLSLFMVFYAYFGYPFSLVIIKNIMSKEVKRESVTPGVTLIITAFNEEKRIQDKLENSIVLEYPEGKLQILVASDGSVDGTNDIVRSYEAQGVELLEVVNRGGKENAQKEAVPYARGDIIVFSDVATILEPQGLMEIVSNFADPSIGCVSSEDRLIGQDGKPSGEGFYVRYEMWLRGVSEPKAIGSYLNIADESREFERKVRTVLRGLTVFFKHLEFLNIYKHRFSRE